MEDRIKKLEDAVVSLSETINIGFQKIDDNFQLLDKKVELVDRKLELLDRKAELLAKKVEVLDDKVEILGKKVDVIQGNSVSTIEILETGINNVRTELNSGVNDIRYIKGEIQKISVVTRYENDYPYLNKNAPGEDGKLLN